MYENKDRQKSVKVKGVKRKGLRRRILEEYERKGDPVKRGRGTLISRQTIPQYLPEVNSTEELHFGEQELFRDEQ